MNQISMRKIGLRRGMLNPVLLRIDFVHIIDMFIKNIYYPDTIENNLFDGQNTKRHTISPVNLYKYQQRHKDGLFINVRLLAMRLQSSGHTLFISSRSD